MARCGYCGRMFARNEHLTRHQRIHTGERPFQCQKCQAGFQRADVLAKHIEKIHSDGTPAPGNSTASKSKPPRDHEHRERSKLACDQCRKRKLKCDNSRPCGSCRAKTLDCTVSSTSRPPGRPRHALRAPHTSPSLSSEIHHAPVATSITYTMGSPEEGPGSSHGQSPGLGTAPGRAVSATADPPWVTHPHNGSFDMEGISHTATTGSTDNRSHTLNSEVARYAPVSQIPEISSVLPVVETDTSRMQHAESRTSTQGQFDAFALSLTQVDTWMTTEVSPGVVDPPPFLTSVGMQLPEPTNAASFLEDLLPSADFGSWLDGLHDFSLSDDGLWSFQGNMTLDPELNSPMEGAVEIIKEQLHHRSRASSPTPTAQQRAWYSVPPQLAAYDDGLINVLLNIARKHISPTFALFKEFSADSSRRVELCLAMAAIGGFYCSPKIPNRTKVAKMLYNDARRLLLENYLENTSGTPLTLGDALDSAQTFVLLEIYGFLSGDKRAYEFIEVFHGSKMHATMCCTEMANSSNGLDTATHIAQQQKVRLLQDAIRILDNYRILFLHRPPAFEGHQLPGGNEDINSGNTDGMHNLATIIRYSWSPSPRGVKGAPSSAPLWRAEFVQLALDRWLDAKIQSVSPKDCPDLCTPSNISEMLLYHLAQITLSSNMGILERVVVQEGIKLDTGSNTNEFGPGLAVNISQHTDSIGMQPWLSKHQYEISLWHAKAILRIGLDCVAGSQGDIKTARAPTSAFDIASYVEPPHISLCVYFATLIVWIGESMRVPGYNSDVLGNVTSKTGMQLLSSLHVPVSTILSKSLSNILEGNSGN